uniref:Benzoate carboxyl methyltransferase n=2 Tax=Cajanus cajan TaxID=3821 RepID=A0A151TPE6_CAJCA|nr:Benzoate carboxyl methyltransferase [Cajanus cajan]
MQKKVMLKVKPIVEESLVRLLSSTNFKSNLKVADLGCSSGPNALMVLYDIITIINNHKVSLNQDASATVLQIYLNDLFENDFNNIMKLLPNFYHKIKEMGDKVSTCFIHVTPGNFYGRLFPNNHIHFFHSSYSLHWLSQAPEELTNGVEPLNKGNTYITTTSSPTVYKAYFEQFQRDFKLFLKSRSDELKPCGVMVLTFIGREKAHEISSPWVVIGVVLKDMVLEGLVEEAKLDSFNLSIYGPTIEEVRQVIEAEGSFTLQTLKTFKIGWDANLQEEVVDFVLDSKMRGEFIAKSIRSVFEPLLTVEFGKDIMDELFLRFSKKVSQLIALDTLEYTNLVMSMRKK